MSDSLILWSKFVCVNMFKQYSSVSVSDVTDDTKLDVLDDHESVSES